MNTICFLFDGNRLSEANMEDDDMIEARYTRKLLAGGTFAAALATVPSKEDWSRSWAAGRTIMLRRTSKSVKGAVENMSLLAVVHLSRSFWYAAHNDTAAEKLQLVMIQLPLMTDQVQHHHTRAAGYERTRCRDPCRSAGAVPSADAP